MCRNGNPIRNHKQIFRFLTCLGPIMGEVMVRRGKERNWGKVWGWSVQYSRVWAGHDWCSQWCVSRRYPIWILLQLLWEWRLEWYWSTQWSVCLLPGELLRLFWTVIFIISREESTKVVKRFLKKSMLMNTVIVRMLLVDLMVQV